MHELGRTAGLSATEGEKWSHDTHNPIDALPETLTLSVSCHSPLQQQPGLSSPLDRRASGCWELGAGSWELAIRAQARPSAHGARCSQPTQRAHGPALSNTTPRMRTEHPGGAATTEEITGSNAFSKWFAAIVCSAGSRPFCTWPALQRVEAMARRATRRSHLDAAISPSSEIACRWWARGE